MYLVEPETTTNVTPHVKTTRRLRAWWAERRDVQWRWVIFPGLAIVLINIVIIGTIISLYAAVLSVQLQDPGATSDAVASGAEAIGTFVSPIILIFTTAIVAYWVARRQGAAVAWYGLMIGLTSGAASAVQVALFSGAIQEILFNFTFFTFLPFPMLAGWFGAWRSQTALAEQERLYRASLAVGHAHSPQTLVRAVGNHLAEKNVSLIGLWEILLQGERGAPLAVSLLASWAPEGKGGVPLGFQFDADRMPPLLRLAETAPLQLKTEDLVAGEQANWEAVGTRSLLLIPLITPLGEWVGLLTVHSGGGSGFGRRAEQDFVTIAGQVALVLENMRLVAQAQETAVLQERQRLAREIHDTLAQGFTSIVMHLEAAEQGIPTALQTTQHHLTQARQTARESLGQARRVVDDLRPELLESRPLDEALGRVAHNWSMQSGIPAALQVTGAAQKLHPQVEVTLLRATQEALNNIRKHARAERVAVTLSYLDDMVILDVQDDGRGFVAAAGAEETAVSSGFGLVAMRERVEQLGGELVIESEPDEGATLMVSIPIGAMPDAG